MYSRFWQYFLYDLDLVPVKDYAKKLINQGMILGNSAFISREVGTDNYFSKGIVKKVKTQLIHVDVQFVNTNNELDLDALRNWQPQFKNANFELYNNKFIVHREVEKMSKSKYNVINPDQICNDYGADTLRLYLLIRLFLSRPTAFGGALRKIRLCRLERLRRSLPRALRQRRPGLHFIRLFHAKNNSG